MNTQPPHHQPGSSQTGIDDAITTAWDFSDPRATESRFIAMLDSQTLTQRERCEILTQVARAQGLDRRFEEARETLAQASGLLDPGDHSSRASIRWRLEAGRVENTSGAPGRGLDFFQQAWESALASSEKDLAVDAAHMLAIIAPDPEASLRWNEQALELAESSDVQRARRWVASLANNIGWTHHEAGRYEQALDMFERALRERESHPEQRRPLLVARWCVARCLRSLGRTEESLQAQLAIAAEHEKDGTEDGFVYEEIGECLVALGREVEAAPHMARAWRLLKAVDWLQRTEPERLARLDRIGGVSGDSLQE